MKYFSTFATLIFLTSCQENYPEVGFRVPSCVQEIDRRYASESDFHRPIYKIEKIDGPEIDISVWRDNTWYFKGPKPRTYFYETKTFRFESCPCPDGSDEKGIADKIKSINI